VGLEPPKSETSKTWNLQNLDRQPAIY